MLRNLSRALLAAKPLVVAETTATGSVVPATLSAIRAAAQLGDVTVLVTGENDDGVAQVGKAEGVKKILYGKTGAGFLPEDVCPIVLASQEKHNYTHILAPATAAGKNILPRVAAKLDVAMVSEITGIESEDTFVRLIYAGNAVCKVKSKDEVKVLSVRPTNFDPVEMGDGSVESETIEGVEQSVSKMIGQSVVKGDRPSLSSAKTVVSGGRGMGKDGKGSENFDMLHSLADKLGAAVGASRAAVDAGYVPNDYQIGQTGKIVAPELYMAIGISGAIQHVAGMKDSKVIVSINKDPEAPIFEISDYGLVADLYSAVPEFQEKC